MMNLTSSVVVLKAMGLEPDGIPATTAGVCALCGLDIPEGDLCSPLSLGPGFMDDLSMSARGSHTICGHCGALLTADGLRKTGYGAFSAVGVAPFRKWADIAQQVTEPPEPPFVMAYATANNQHMAWRSPVNFSRDLFYVRVGLRDLKIRRQTVLASVDTCRVLGEAINYKRRIQIEVQKALNALSLEREEKQALDRNLHGILKPVWVSRTVEQAIKEISVAIPKIEQSSLKKALQMYADELVAGDNSGRKMLPNPFLQLSPDLKDADHGLLRPMVWESTFHSVFEKEITEIVALTAGEVWALRFLLTPGAGSAATGEE